MLIIQRMEVYKGKDQNPGAAMRHRGDKIINTPSHRGHEVQEAHARADCFLSFACMHVDRHKIDYVICV
jgi:hypothetical protein